MDAEIIARIRQSDRGAFDQLCNEYYDAMMSYARLFNGAHDAEDIVQEVLVSVWENRRTLDGDSSVIAYLLRSVYNRSVNLLARRHRHEKYSSYYRNRIESLTSVYCSPDYNDTIRNIYDGELRKKMDFAIENLPPRCREAFRLRFVSRMKRAEIAARMGVSESTVANQINKAIKLLRDALGKVLVLFLLVSI